MRQNYYYANEKFADSIRILSTGTGSFSDRLLHIFSGPLLMITTDHLPAKHHNDWNFIQSISTKYQEPSPSYRSNYPNADMSAWSPLRCSMRRITNITGQKIAIKIYNIWLTLDSISRDN